MKWFNCNNRQTFRLSIEEIESDKNNANSQLLYLKNQISIAMEMLAYYNQEGEQRRREFVVLQSKGSNS
jgi:hypothetical protein